LSKLKPEVFSQLLKGSYDPPKETRSVPDFTFYPQNKSGELYQPILDQSWVSEHDRPVWPDGKQFAVCLSHDVDAVSELDLRQNLRSIWKLAKPGSAHSLGEILRWTLIHKLNAFKGLLGRNNNLCEFEKWLQIEKEHGARSTFFFAPESVNLPHRTDCMYLYDQLIPYEDNKITVAELMQKMDNGGWEVGLHPSWFAHDNVDEMKYQKQQVEQAIGHSIQSVRQHFLKHDPDSTPGVQESAGFLYDSTIGFNDNVGFRRGTSYPYPLFDLKTQQQLKLLEIPLIAQDGAMLLSEKGMRLNRDAALDYIKLLLERVKDVGGVLTLSWHPHTIKRPGFWELYKETLDMVAKEDPWFATVGEVGKWWNENVNVDLLKFTSNLSEK
jgi:peptidoglycan/xylan/chitin deacetylase (PgdA/CDA1 family)